MHIFIDMVLFLPAPLFNDAIFANVSQKEDGLWISKSVNQ
jgi:hypothetical protein